MVALDFARESLRPRSKYWVCVITRNGAETIGRTLDSILGQTFPPGLIVVVDDGSTDETLSIIESTYVTARTELQVIRLPDRGYDIRRVPANINTAYSHVNKAGREFDYSMISGDDCIYPPNYSEYLISEMEQNHRLVIASGDWGLKPPPDLVKAPQGAGRFVREIFWKRVGGRYPVAYGWETWLLFKALQLGYNVANFTDLRYIHLRPSGSAHRFAHWGIAMRTLGYYEPMVFLRVVRNILLAAEPISIRGNIAMLASYLMPHLYRHDPYFRYFELDLRRFIRAQQVDRIRRFLKRLLSR